jgi:phenylalanyl-tRNA synthetase alpha chain
MIDRVKKYLNKVENFSSSDIKKIEEFRLSYAGKKGILNDLFKAFKNVPSKEKKTFGKELNELKQAVNKKIKDLKFKSKTHSGEIKINDTSRTAFPIQTGNRHPISIVKNKIIEIFSQIGFCISEGPEIEDDWHNFSALNLPLHHPARDMQDTFFIQTSPDILLRTHTSSVQVRFMENNHPPIRTISPGRVFRNEAISARSHCIFHQVEGLYIDKNVSFSDLKQTLLYLTKALFGKSKMRSIPIPKA